MAAIEEMLGEFQGYVMAYRLRAAIGGRVVPPGPQLSLSEYAAKRLTRQDLARRLVTEGLHPLHMKSLDALSDELMFGFWLNPREVSLFLTAVLRHHPHPAIGDPGAFGALLTPSECERLGPGARAQVVEHYLTCLTLAAPLMDPASMGRVWEKIEATQPPLFVDELARAGQLGAGV